MSLERTAQPPLFKNNSLKLYHTNTTDLFKSATYECNKWVRCGHLNPPHSHVQA